MTICISKNGWILAIAIICNLPRQECRRSGYMVHAPNYGCLSVRRTRHFHFLRTPCSLSLFFPSWHGGTNVLDDFPDSISIPPASVPQMHTPGAILVHRAYLICIRRPLICTPFVQHFAFNFDTRHSFTHTGGIPSFLSMSMTNYGFCLGTSFGGLQYNSVGGVFFLASVQSFDSF